MRYTKINDDLEYVYGVLQKIPPIFPVAALPRDNAKEKEFYALKDDFQEANPPCCKGWKILAKIPMFNTSQGILYRIYSFQSNDKSVLVAAQYQKPNTLHYGYPEIPVFYGQKILQQAQYILFTDNLLLAVSLQNHFYDESVWAATSFLEKSDLDKLDFSIFSGKTVIYYLVEHSGNDWRTTCLNASDLIKRFPKNATVYLLSYPEKEIISSRVPYWPAFLSKPEDLEDEIKGLENQPNIPPSTFWTVPQVPKRQEIAEGILSRTLTWLYDASPVIRTSYLTHWATSVSQGVPGIQAHDTFPPRTIAYLYIAPSDDGFMNGFQSAFESILHKKILPPLPPPDPCSVSETEEILTQRDFFLEYPRSKKPFTKLKPNFYYAMFWPEKTLGTANMTEAVFLLLNRILDNLERCHPDTDIIILDIPALWSMGLPLARLAEFFHSARSQYAIILSTGVPRENRKCQILNLPFDRIIRMQRRASDPEEVSIDLVSERDDLKQKQQTLRLIRGQNESQWKSRCAVKLSVKEKILYVRKHPEQAIKKTAIELGVSESYIKRLRRMACVSKKVPARAPKYPKRTTKYSSIR